MTSRPVGEAAVQEAVRPAGRAGARRPRPPGQLFQPVSWQRFWILGAGAIVALLLVWYLVTALGLVSPMILPAPGDVLSAGLDLARSGQLAADTWASVERVMIGFAISLVVALPIGVLMGTLGWFEALLEPLIDFIRYMPAVAFVPLTIVWFGVDESQKYAILFIGTFFQQVLMVMDNVKRTPHEFVQVGQTIGLSRVKQMLRIVLPASAPALWDTIRVTLGWAWTWLVVAELVAAPDGLGQRIVVSQRYLATDRIFFLIGLIGLIGLVSDQVLKALGRVLFPWASRGAK
ncbi:ABC transporter permease [Propionicicella superfundia]|uniref:ABC transporter permease n=1 Tax=Propionicicella superfundia TaxID=348582 RepID=UPI000428FE43|nr:ABC transporter permease [Propionicicella superfundia]